MCTLVGGNTEIMAEGPLDGVRVLELGSTVAGPFCARLLADFGADVVKIEVPEGDPVRSFGKRHLGKSLYASSIFRNKRMASVNLREERGRDLIKDLVGKFDVLIENFKPGTLSGWGVGYTDCRRVKPDIVYVSVSGYGQFGPRSAAPVRWPSCPPAAPSARWSAPPMRRSSPAPP